MDQDELLGRLSRLELKVIELESRIPKKKNALEKSIGIPVWEAYAAAFKKRYGVEPIRNAKVNRNCLDIAKRLGEDSIQVAQFYLTLSDQQFIRMNHPIGILLLHCESIHSMWRTGRMTTADSARMVERRINSVNASQQYLQRKHGKNESGQG